MSLARLQMMRDQLEEKGWEIFTEEGSNNWLDLCDTRNEFIDWYLKHKDPKISNVILEFILVGEMGRDTSDLRDIWFCNVKDSEIQLPFDKIKSREWNENLKSFINQLSLI